MRCRICSRCSESEDETASLVQMDPQIRRQRTLEAVKRVLVRETLDQPCVVIFEDLHWIDSETQAFLELLSESVATAKLLLLVDYRPEYTARLGEQDLLHAAAARSAGGGGGPGAAGGSSRGGNERGAGGAGTAGPGEDRGQPLLHRGGGADAGRGGGAGGRAGPLPPGAIPGRAAHPGDGAGGAGGAHRSAAGGGEGSAPDAGGDRQGVPLRPAAGVAEGGEEDLRGRLSHLQAGEFIYEQPAFPEPEYTFKHALTQEVAYGSLLVERRRPLHERTARAIEELYRDGLDEHYGELAHHYGRTENTAKAVEYLHLAGEQAASSARPTRRRSAS